MKIDAVVKELEKRGFKKEALEVKEAVDFFSVSRAFQPTHRQPRMFPQQPRQGPSDKSTVFAEPGEKVKHLDAITGLEKTIRWNMDKPLPIDKKKELEYAVDIGEIGTDWLEGAYNEIGDRDNKVFVGYLLGKTKNKKKKILRDRLASILAALDKSGYVILVKKLKTAVDEYTKEVLANEEHHIIPSVEQVYEKSKSPHEFDKEVKKLISVHNKITDIVRRFKKDYENKILDKIDLGKLTDDEAVNATLHLVTKADTLSDKEVSKISK